MTPLIVSIALIAGSPAPDARSSDCSIARDRTRYGTWMSVAVPKMPRPVLDADGAAGVARSNRNIVHAYAVDPNDPKILYVADELTVMRSTDGGCTWSKSFSVLDGGELSSETDAIVSLHAVAVSARETRVYALMRHGHHWCCSDDLSVSLPRLAVLDHSGDWTVRDPVVEGSGTPVVGEAGRLWVAAGTPSVMYMSTNDYSRSGPALYASTDDGRSWQLRGTREVATSFVAGSAQACRTASVCAAVDYRVLEPDPLQPHVLWSAADHVLLKSEDGGSSWRPALRLDWFPALVDVYHQAGAPARIAVLGSSREGAWSSDGGETWRKATLFDGGGRVLSTASRSANEVAHVDDSGRPQITNGRWTRDISPEWDATETAGIALMRDVTYVPAARSYYFLGSDKRDLRERFENSVVSFTPRPLRRPMAR